MSDRETQAEAPEDGRTQRLVAIRGAVRVERNEREAIVRETRRLLEEIQERNRLYEERVVSVFFTMTPDLNAGFPARAARELGWTETAMLGAQETPVPGAMERVIRVLVHARAPGTVRHVYLGDAAALRPDLAGPSSPSGGSGSDVLVVVGLGLVGGSVALALQRSGTFREIVGHDVASAALEQARRVGAVDAALPSGADGRLAAALERADVVLLALPVPPLLAWLRERGRDLSPGTVVMDVGSTKQEVVRAMDRLPPGVEAVGAHPMAGSEESGMSAARPDLLRGASWALVETARTGPRARRVASAVVEALGGRACWMDAGPHDETVAATSHLPYLLSAVLGSHLDRRARDLPVRELLGPGARDMLRLAGSDPDVMGGVLATNWPRVREEALRFGRRLEDLVRRLDEAREAAAGDRAAFHGALGPELLRHRRARERVLP